MRTFISQCIPRSVQQLLNKWLVRNVKYRGGKYRCPVCKTNLAYFNRLPDYYLVELEKFRHVHSIFMLETLNILQYACPHCNASDRDRLYAIYVKQKHEDLGAGNTIKFLDFAPTASLSRFIKSLPSFTYRSADLFSGLADDRVDLMNMLIYPANSVDAFLCSHVLEHVSDDRQAMRELFRIVRPGGWGIVMVPIQLSIDHTLEDPAHASEAERWKFYGQFDHVRMYSKHDFVSRLTQVGFSVKQLDVGHFGQKTFQMHGISVGSVLYVVEKNAN